VQELLSYLLLFRDRYHGREKLITLLWSDRSTAQSRRYLRQTLWQLHSALAISGHPTTNFLLVEDDWLQISPTIDLWLDVWEFEQAFAQVQGRPVSTLNDQEVYALDNAARLYRGDLLENWYQEWCIFERERLQNMYLAILDKLMDYCEWHQDYEVGIDYGTRILRCDRARERTHRRLMRLYSLAGDRTGALRQYESCVNTLKEELGVRPARRTLDLYHQIQDGGLIHPLRPSPANENLSADMATSLATILKALGHFQATLTHVQGQVNQNVESIKTVLDSRR
jgi:DNA-binding SARP family transcriptional activator